MIVPFIEQVGLDVAAKYFERAPSIATTAARLAINQVAERKGLKAAREAMEAQVAFPSGYLTAPRFLIRQRASNSSLEAVIAGRHTPTSLARFVTSGRGRRRGTPLTVQVHPGRPITLNRAWLINLRNGNVGLAVRLRSGEQLLNRRLAARTINSGPLRGVTLLYGPSVDQVFRTVAGDIAPALADDLATEFLRQFVRLSGDA